MLIQRIENSGRAQVIWHLAMLTLFNYEILISDNIARNLTEVQWQEAEDSLRGGYRPRCLVGTRVALRRIRNRTIGFGLLCWRTI